MIKFFKNIRRQLLGKGKTGNYFKYAIGEIVLVVIGILIALQINNWNEERKNKVLLHKVLLALKTDLNTDLIAINHHLNYSKMVVNDAKKMLTRSRKKSATLDTLIYLGKNKFRPFWVTPLQFNKTTFESIKSSGEFQLLTDTLRSAVINLYNKQNYYLNNLETFNTEYKNRLYNYSQSYISSFTDEENYLVKDISWQGINKKEFAIKFDGILSYKKELWEYYLNSLTSQKSKTTATLLLIENELKND